MRDFYDVKPGDKICRYFYGTIMNLTVDKVEDGIIHSTGGWMFHQINGKEYDPDLGMTDPEGVTISFLLKEGETVIQGTVG